MPKSGYHHGDLRSALIEAAVKLVEASGPDGVSMRQVAREAGVSAAAPYRHFRDRDELMSAVAAASHHMLKAHMARAAASAGSPMGQYQAHGIAVVTYAVAHPHLFRVMHHAVWSAPDASPEMAQVRALLDADAAALVTRARAAGQLSASSPAAQMLAAEATVYGLARLFVDGRMAAYGFPDEDAGQLAEAVTNILGVGLLPR